MLPTNSCFLLYDDKIIIDPTYKQFFTSGYEGEGNDSYYNYLYSMFFMILLIMLISLLFTSYFTTSLNSNNMAPNNSTILNSLNK